MSEQDVVVGFQYPMSRDKGNKCVQLFLLHSLMAPTLGVVRARRRAITLPLFGELCGDEFLHASFTSQQTRPCFLLYYYAEGQCFFGFISTTTLSLGRLGTQKRREKAKWAWDDSAGCGVELSSHWGVIYRGERAWQTPHRLGRPTGVHPLWSMPSTLDREPSLVLVKSHQVRPKTWLVNQDFCPPPL